MPRRVEIEIRGIVQDLGFRPYVYHLAQQHALSGRFSNDASGVTIEVEGEDAATSEFLAALRRRLPLLARVDSIRLREHLEPCGYRGFAIDPSLETGESAALVAPDRATCADCLRELFDARDRRYRYPFINCSHCGPRFTILDDPPYHHERTTTRPFAMCAECAAEYYDPASRRFLAQANACPACGPRAYFVVRGASLVGRDPIGVAAEWLRSGCILAIKGVGGFHLACLASDPAAVERLRTRKRRYEEPLALMARDSHAVEAHCEVDRYEYALLVGPDRPIVLLRRRAGSPLPDAIAPGQRYLGFMLPYAPLHHLLLAECGEPVVMTSGNLAEEPIAYRDDDALERLDPVADAFLMHDRDIRARSDDSVTRVVRTRELPIRRSRGRAPDPVPISFDFDAEVLACGAELKNTFALGRGRQVFVAAHVGNLEGFSTFRAYEEGIEHFKRLFRIEPRVVAHDLHPDYLSTRYALAIDDVRRTAVQHHHAHVAACMAEHGLDGEVLGAAFDGAGYGTDGCLWGSEFLAARLDGFDRICHLDYAPLPGGSQAIREPWRMACVYLQKAFGDAFLHLADPFTRRLDLQKWRALERMIAHGLNSPSSSGMGRLFDAVSSLLELHDCARYEGQAAVALEMAADRGCASAYDFGLARDGSTLDPSPVIRSIVNDLRTAVTAGTIAAKFHNAVVGAIAFVAERARRERGLDRVVLSGGVFQNALLLEWTCARLEALGFGVYSHERVPTNDGGIAFGQAVVAGARLRSGAL